MTYTVGGLIDNADYNTFQNNLNDSSPLLNHPHVLRKWNLYLRTGLLILQFGH